MSIRAVVVDDEPLARTRLTRLLTAEGVNVLYQGCNGQEAISLVEIDVLFIDINMPIKNGLQAAQEISAMDRPPAIVFCTAYDEYAVQAFKTNAVSYLLKPIQAEDIRSALEKASSLSRFQIGQMLDQKEIVSYLTIHYQGFLQNIPLSEFLYFRSVNKNIFATLLNGEDVLVDKSLKQLEADLGNEFIRIHRGVLMNRHQVSRLIRQEDGKVFVILKSLGIRLAVSRRHLSEVKKCFV